MKLAISYFALMLAASAFAQAVSVKSYRQLLAEDHAGIMNRKPGVIDAREEAISRCGYSPIGLFIVNHVGFPSADTGIKGLRLGVLASENHTVYGLDVNGATGFVTYDFGGLQFSSIFNRVGDTMSGLQVSCVNYAETLSGLQFGVYNHATHGSGLQLGIVNFANALRGVQLGIFNINESAAWVYLPFVNVAF